MGVNPSHFQHYTCCRMVGQVPDITLHDGGRQEGAEAESKRSAAHLDQELSGYTHSAGCHGDRKTIGQEEVKWGSRGV